MSPSTSPGSTYHENLCTNRRPRTLDSAGPDRRDFASPVDTADVRDNPGCPRLQRYPSPAKERAARPLPGQTHATDPVPRTQLKNRVQSRLSRTQPPHRSRLPASLPPTRPSMTSGPLATSPFRPARNLPVRTPSTPAPGGPPRPSAATPRPTPAPP